MKGEIDQFGPQLAVSAELIRSPFILKTVDTVRVFFAARKRPFLKKLKEGNSL